MAKVTRSVLKEIVKECLVEILSEGLHSTGERLVENKAPKTKKKNRVDPDVFVQRNKMLNSKTQNQAIEKKVNSLTNDPLMRDILADTASTTLVEQKSGEGPAGSKSYVPSDAASKVVYDSSPEDLFEGSQNWAALAFSGTKK
tara:strand:+ start:130 stop:558 length:429 start_codon:yes stop_codon:yes gene_type:complete